MADFIKTQEYGKTTLHVWNLTTADATGESMNAPGASDRTVQFIGTNWGSATAILEGSLDGTNFFTLTDGPGNDISFTNDGGEMIAENVLFLRPQLSVGGTLAVIQVRLLSRGTMR